MTEDPPATPAAEPDGLRVEESPPPPEVILARLRRQFPNWAILHDPHTGVWTALRVISKRDTVIQRPDALLLGQALEEFCRGRR